MENNTNNGIVDSLENIPGLTGELTPISVKEAESIVGEESCYQTGESIATAILDFTAIARAYLRTVSKFRVLKITDSRYN